MMATQNTPYTSYTEADYKALWERRNDKTGESGASVGHHRQAQRPSAVRLSGQLRLV